MITIFTPTFNRAYIIENVYKSLKAQTFKEFEWLVVDDGSSDKTENLFKEWQNQDNFFKIKYYKTDNGGKHRAINFGIQYAQGDKFFIIDSDDYIFENTLQRVSEWFETIKGKELEFCGVAGNRGKNSTDIWGTTFEGNTLDSTYLDNINNNITGDKAEIYFTDVLRKNKFPEFQNEKFIQEGAVWYELANQGYKLRYFNEIIYITEYLEDGLSANPTRMRLENPQGFAFVLKQQIKYYKKNHVRQMSNYSVYYNAVKSKTTFKDAAKYLKISKTFLFISVYVTKTKNKLRSILSTIK